MGTNKRYAEQIDARNADRFVGLSASPVTLPQQAYGPRPLEWTQGRPPVWVWVQWRDRAAERLPCYVKGSNDRVCVVAVDGPGGGWEITVWRAAVTHRKA